MSISPRLAAILDALPLKPGIRVLEIGCGPGVLARAIAERLHDGYVLAIDRSAKAIAQAEVLSEVQMKSGKLSYRQASIEEFELADGEGPFDLVVAVRVGALDGRHPAAGKQAIVRIAGAMKPDGRLFVDGREMQLEGSL